MDDKKGIGDLKDQIEKTELKKLTLENKKLKIENKKLAFELENLHRGKRISPVVPYLPFITILITLAGLGFAVYQYTAQQQANREAQVQQSIKAAEAQALQSKKETQSAQQEFMKPLLQNQLSLYLQATTAAATIAHSTDPTERGKAINDFWRLYDGPLIMVETQEVSGAMVQFGKCLDKTESFCDENEMTTRARALASRMQESILKSWNTNPENFTSDKFIYR